MVFSDLYTWVTTGIRTGVISKKQTVIDQQEQNNKALIFCIEKENWHCFSVLLIVSMKRPFPWVRGNTIQGFPSVR